MVDHIANYFNDKSKLFLAHTNPAIDYLKRKVTAQDSTFRTISSQIYRTASDPEYDLLVIDECSTVSNADLLKVLEKTSFKLLVLVGDVYQIESIQFGNWFGIIRSFIPSTSVFELTTPFRTKSESLLGFWDKVRNIDDDIAEVIARNSYSTVLDKVAVRGPAAGRDHPVPELRRSLWDQQRQPLPPEQQPEPSDHLGCLHLQGRRSGLVQRDRAVLAGDL